MNPPLAGTRILDFSRVIAGPLCTQHLADLGAEVIKVENPLTGDEVRGRDDAGGAGRSSFFIAFNRSKKSVAIDLKTADGQKLIRELANHCDVLIENFRPGVMARFGLDQETLRAANPRLIYVSISAYGAEGEMSDRPGFDPVLQAESGMMALTGPAGGEPQRHPLSLIDTLTAAQAVGAVCAALLSRHNSGRGDFIDLALVDTALGALGNAGLHYLSSGQVPPRTGNSHMTATPTDLFRTKTRPIYMAVSTDRLFGQFCRDVLGRDDLPDDPRFVDPRARLAHRDELKTIIETILMTQPSEHWLAKLRHLPAGEVRTLDKALASTEAMERQMVRTIEEPDGALRVLGSPFKFRDAPLAEFGSPPYLGADTDAVLSDLLGTTEAELAELRQRGALK